MATKAKAGRLPVGKATAKERKFEADRRRLEEKRRRREAEREAARQEGATVAPAAEERPER